MPLSKADFDISTQHNFSQAIALAASAAGGKDGSPSPENISLSITGVYENPFLQITRRHAAYSLLGQHGSPSGGASEQAFSFSESVRVDIEFQAGVSEVISHKA